MPTLTVLSDLERSPTPDHAGDPLRAILEARRLRRNVELLHALAVAALPEARAQVAAEASTRATGETATPVSMADRPALGNDDSGVS